MLVLVDKGNRREDPGPTMELSLKIEEDEVEEVVVEIEEATADGVGRETLVVVVFVLVDVVVVAVAISSELEVSTENKEEEDDDDDDDDAVGVGKSPPRDTLLCGGSTICVVVGVDAEIILVVDDGKSWTTEDVSILVPIVVDACINVEVDEDDNEMLVLNSGNPIEL